MLEPNQIVDKVAGEFPQGGGVASNLLGAIGGGPLSLGMGILSTGFNLVQQNQAKKEMERRAKEMRRINRQEELSQINKQSAEARSNLPKFEALPYGRSEQQKFSV